MTRTETRMITKMLVRTKIETVATWLVTVQATIGMDVDERADALASDPSIPDPSSHK